jgi:Fungal chitosanase of glycosyl hydrolase group 75
MIFRRASCAFLLSLGFAGGAHAQGVQDLPPRDVLAAMVHQITGKPPQTAITFHPRSGAVDNLCRLEPAQMNLTRDGNAVRSFSVLVDRASGSDGPGQFFATLSRVAVDADGAGRSYHPEDPLGKGECEQVMGADGKMGLSGICALDQFSSGGAYVFSGTQKLSKDAFVSNWRSMWPKIRDRSLKPVVLADVYPDVPKDFYFFHWRERGLTAFFKDNIIPKDLEGYPCRYGRADGMRNGYFISSTTLENNSVAREDGCAPHRYLDAENVPFIVLPKGGFGKVHIGDIAIVGRKDKVVYAIVGDAGPATKLGEGSIALNAMLLGKFGDPFPNMKATWNLDIGGSSPVSLLVLGGTNKYLRGNYSAENVEAVARQELARWNGHGDPLRRFEACRAAAPVNAAK